MSVICNWDYANWLLKQLAKRHPTTPGNTWAVCAGWPDANIKHFWVTKYSIP